MRWGKRVIQHSSGINLYKSPFVLLEANIFVGCDLP